MAIEFARVEYVKRAGGGNVCRSAAYNARDDLRCALTGERFYFSHRDGLLHSDVLLPEGASERFRDIGILWNAAQAAEKRKDSQEARELLLALPSNPGLTLTDWRTLAEEFAIEHLVSKGVAVQIDIHAPHEGHTNVHAHLLITTRRLEGEGFAARKARDLDPEIRAGKNGRAFVSEGDAWNELWKNHQNRYFEERGFDIRVDETGIVAQRHEGPVRLRTVPEAAGSRAAANDDLNADAVRDPEQVLTALTRRRATFTELDIERQLKKYVPDGEERARLRQAILAHGDVVVLHDRATGEVSGRYTTGTVRRQEESVMADAATVRVGVAAIPARYVAAAAGRRTMDAGQHAAFLQATGTDGLVLIDGIAGAGKSYSMEAIREAHEASGWKVIGLAPSNDVAENMRRGGFSRASTAHRELYAQEQGRYDRAPAWDRQTLVIVDEAAMLDTGVYARLMAQAAKAKAKVVLVGDDRQLASVERGGMFTVLKEQHGSTGIDQVRRQDADWQRDATVNFANGHVAEGLRAYAAHGCVHWSDGLDEARTRLLSDWDQDSRAQPDIGRFVYASTNAEVNELNQAIHDIRVRRGEVETGRSYETSRGTVEIGAGDRVVFFANDRKAGLINGAGGTVTATEGRFLAVQTDRGQSVRIDTEEFTQYGLGYAGTVYRGQGKTQGQVYALYDNAFAWNARTAYVGMTRHTEAVQLYVPTSLAKDELALGRQMSRRMRDEASLAYATAGEVINLTDRHRPQPAPPGRSGAPAATVEPRPVSPPQGSSGAASRPETGRLPQAEVATLRQLDLTAFAREQHGYMVEAAPARPEQGDARHYRLTRARPDGGSDRLEVRQVAGGHWTFRDPADPRVERGGDILDFARREGAANLADARVAVAAWQAGRSDATRSEAMREPENRRQKLESEKPAEIDPNDPDAAAKRAGAENQRRLDLAGAENADRQDAIAVEAERRQEAARAEAAKRETSQQEETAKQDRLNAEARQAGEVEQARLRDAQERQPADHDHYTAYSSGKAEQARQATGITGPEAAARAWQAPTPDQDAFPESAALRYSESLARNYDGRDPYGSLARSGLADSVTFQREQHELNKQIATEADPARRDMLSLRRDIENADYKAQTYERIAGLSQAITGDEHHPDALAQRQKADGFQKEAQEARRTWEERSLSEPQFYPPLNEAMRARVDAARYEQERARDPGQSSALPPDQAPLGAAPTQAPPDRPDGPQGPGQSPGGENVQSTTARESDAMRRLNLPEYAAEKHGYSVEWQNDAHSKAVLRKAGDTLNAGRATDGTWEYRSRKTEADRGDIVDFEKARGAGTRDKARDVLRPTLEKAEPERGQPLDQLAGLKDTREREPAVASRRADAVRDLPPEKDPAAKTPAANPYARDWGDDRGHGR